MKALTIITFLLLSTVLVSQTIVTIPNLLLDNGDTVFIKKVNYFEYNLNQYIIDTSIVNNGGISFQKTTGDQQLFNLSNNTNPPSTYLPLLQLREHYTSMFCSNFYSHGSYILVTDSFSKTESKFLKEFYEDFTYNSFDKNLFKGGDYKRMTIQKAFALIEKQQIKYLNHLNKRGNELSPKFIEYVNTEIKLGAINQFLNWYEETHDKEIQTEFSQNNLSMVHDSIYNKIQNRRWNVNSIQYFRSLERILNYKESKRRKIFQTYFSEIPKRQSLIEELINKTASNTK